MSSTHRSSHHSSSKSKHSSSHSSSKSKHQSSSKESDDWSEITDPEERRRVQNRIAQRKFRDKAKDTKEREDRDSTNRTHAGHSYHTPDPREINDSSDLSGLPWGSLSLSHVVQKGKSKEAYSDSRRDSEERSYSGGGGYDVRSHGGYEATEPVYEGNEGYYGGGGGSGSGDAQYYEEESAYYDYGSGGSGHGGNSR